MSIYDALQALKNGDYATARNLIAGVKLADFSLQHFLIKGLAETALTDWEEAKATFTAATGRFPDNPLLWLNRGIAEENLKLVAEAIESQEQCLALNPAQAEACGNLSNLYRKMNRFAEASVMAQRALDNGASKGDAFNCLGLALGKQGKFAEAEDAFRQARQEQPHNPDFIANHANLAVDQLRFKEAWPRFAAARAMEDKAVFRHDEGLARLLSGDYELGLALFEARLELQDKVRLLPTCPLWRGESLHNKKLLITAEQGFGDVIHFCRYARFITEGELVWAVPQNLVRLLSGQLRGSVYAETKPLPVCDYYIPIMSLPLATGHACIESSAPYLIAPSALTLPNEIGQNKIGLVWAGSQTHERDHERSIRLEQLAPFFEKVSADFYAPFIGKALDEIGALPVTRLDNLITDFADTAALLKQMDCLVTVDTAVAHLAGALGVLTFLLLPYCPDWRWGIAGETTQWYPNMTILRQPRYGDWRSVIEKLTILLERGF